MTSKTIFSILIMLIGVFFIIYGGIDDSPGGQVLGFLLFAIGVWGIVKR